MDTLEAQSPDKIASGLAALVEGGCFADEGEAARAARVEYLKRSRLALVEQFQQDDIRQARERRRAGTAE